jgi:glycosyltransferase involved in cell wall biosynthesis
MNVLFTVTYYAPYISGLTLAVQRWANGLVLRGHRVTVLAIRHDHSLPQTERSGRLSIQRVPWIAKISKGFIAPAWGKSAWEACKSHDVVVLHLPQPEALIVAVAAKLQGKRIIVVYHCEIQLARGFFAQILQSLMEVAHFCTMLLADRVITYTSDYATHSRLIALWRRSTNKHVDAIVPPIPQPSALPQDVRRFRKKMEGADIVIGLAARIAAEKGIEYLLAALPHIARQQKGKRVLLAVAGPVPVGEGLYSEKIASLVKQHVHAVVFMGSIPPEKMGAFYRCLDMLVLPSTNSTESFGMVQVEAMLMGVPVIATNLPGVRVPIQKTGMGILVPPKKETAIASAVTVLLSNPSRYRRERSAIRRAFPEYPSTNALEAALRG